MNGVFDEGNEISFYDGVPDDIRAKYEEWDGLIERLSAKLSFQGLPANAVFELTPLCNLSCTMCFNRLDKDKMDSIGKLMTAEQWGQIAKETAALGVIYILITGGEPFTHPEFIDIYLNIIKLGFRVVLYTNAVMLNNKIIETLKKYPPVHLYITIYGASEETYDRVCGNNKAYNSVVSNVKILKDILKNIPIELRITLIKDNIHDIDEVRTFAEQMQMKFSIGFGTLKPVRGAEYRNIEKVRLTPEEIIKVRKKILLSIKNEQLYNKYKKSIETHEKYLLNFDNKNISITNNLKNLQCKAATNAYAISWDGKMLPCQIFSSPYTLPLQNGLKDAWNELKDIRGKIKRPDRCFRCKYLYYCGKCPALVQSESGTYIENEQYVCNEC